MVMPNPDAPLAERIERLEEQMRIVAKLFDNLESQIDSVHTHSKTVNAKTEVLVKMIDALTNLHKETTL